MRFASRTGLLAKNVAADLNLPHSENRLAERILSEAHIQRMIALEPGLRNRVMLLLLYTAGLRVSEVCNLRWQSLRARGDAGSSLGALKARKPALFCYPRQCRGIC